jgi:glycosyltransferase involved in cell wall biosynthesis
MHFWKEPQGAGYVKVGGVRIIMFSTSQVWSMGEESGASSMARTIEAYMERGCEVTLVTPREEPGLSARGVDVLSVNVRSYKVLALLPRFAAMVGGSFEFPLRAVLKARKLNSSKPKRSILYGYEISGVLAARLTQRTVFRGQSLVSRFQGVIAHQQILTHDWRSLWKKWDHILAYKVRSDICVMTNDGTRGMEVIEELGNRPHRTLSLVNGVEEIVKFGKSENVHSLQLVTACRLVSWKRVDRSLLVLRELLKRGIVAQLTVVGDGEERSNLEQLGADLVKEGTLIFKGAVRNNEVSEIVGQAHFLLSCNEVSNLGNPVLESLKQGVPVASFEDGSLVGVAVDGESAILASPGKVAELAQKIDDLWRAEGYPELQKGAERAGNRLALWDERFEVECLAVLGLQEEKTKNELLAQTWLRFKEKVKDAGRRGHNT